MRGPILRFIVVLLVYTALILAWPLIAGPMLAGLRGTSNFTFSVTGFEQVRVERADADAPSGEDLVLSLRLPESARGPKQYHAKASGRYFGFVPFAVLLALVVGATPGWRRRLRVFAIGGLVLQLAVCLRLAVYVSARWIEMRGQLPPDVVADLGRGIPVPYVEELEVLLNRNPLSFVVLAVVVWGVLVVRRTDLARWFPASK